MTTRLLEAEALDRTAYRQALRVIMDGLDSLNIDADRAVVDLFDDLRRQTMGIISELGDTPSGPLYQRTLEGIDSSMTDFANRWGLDFWAKQLEGFDLGEDLAGKPIEAGLPNISIGSLGPTTDQLRILAQFRTDLVAGTTAELRKRIRNEVAGVAVGARSFNDAAKAIGANLTDLNHFSTMMHRARAIMVTEIGRAQALATQSAQERAAEVVPNLRKRWLNAHLPGARATHLAAEARYAENGTIGPIPVDAPFSIAGIGAMYPHDPSLPARESVHCHCVSISVVIDPAVTPEPKDPAPAEEEPLTDQDEIRLDDDSKGDLPPRQKDNAERYERLAKPMVKPADWDKMSNAKRLRWVEGQMEADFPTGVEWRKGVVTRQRKRIPVLDRNGDPVFDLRTGKPRTRMATIEDLVPKTIGDTLKTTFNLKDMDADIAFANMNELRSLAVAYPEVAERLAFVGTYRGPKGIEWKPRRTRQFNGELAHASTDGRRIGLSPSFYGDAARYNRIGPSDWNSNFHPVADPKAYLVHEFGHQVENWLGRNPNRSLISVGSRVDGFGTIGIIKETIDRHFANPGGLLASKAAGVTGGYYGISQYAVKSRAEGFAETFVADWYRRNDIEWETGGGPVIPLSELLKTPSLNLTSIPNTITGARPHYGESYNRRGADAEPLLEKFDQFFDLLEGQRLDDLPRFGDLEGYRALSDADKMTHMDQRNALLEEFGGTLGPFHPLEFTATTTISS